MAKVAENSLDYSLQNTARQALYLVSSRVEKYVGKTVRVYRYNDKTGKEDGFDAEVLSVAEGPVLKINGENSIEKQRLRDLDDHPPGRSGQAR